MLKLPKLSYVFLSYNREKYVRAALESAFAQDYKGELEYIISDDCSTDSTFDIIKECVAAYKGNRRIVVTQTPRNLHLAGNTNHALQFVTSDWIVRADDDDLATPDRCTIIGQAIATCPDATCVFNRMDTFTDAQETEVLAQLSASRTELPPLQIHDINDGFDPLAAFSEPLCLHQVWSMKHFRTFGKLPDDANFVDDVVSLYRCAILGKILILPAVTMYIRNGSGNMSRGGDDGKRGYDAIIRLEKFNDTYQNITLRPIEETVQAVMDYRKKYFSESQLQQSQAYIDTLCHNLEIRRTLCTYWRGSTLNRIRIAHKMGYRGLFAALHCLPLPIFAFLLSLYRKFFTKSHSLHEH